MNVNRYTAYAEDSTLRLPLSRFSVRFLCALDPFLDAVDQAFPAAMTDLAERLTAVAKAETPKGLAPRTDEMDAAQALACRHAERFPNLYSAHTDLVRGLLGVDDGTFLHGEDVELSQQCFIRVRYVPKYLMLLALSEAIGRRPAMDFMKQVLDDAVAKLPVREDAPDTIEDLRLLQIEFNRTEQGMDWVQAIVGPHQYLSKVTRCRIQVVLSEYDSELMEVVVCYPDFAMFRHTNPHFVLTRTRTLMSGGPCCDSCYHDDRYVERFTHPAWAAFNALR